MQIRLWGTTLAIVIVLGGCGVPKQQYFAQVARANRLEIHLKKKLDRIDYLEAKDRLAQTRVQKDSNEDVQRLTRLVAEVERVRTALYNKERTLSRCLNTRVAVRPPPPIRHTLRASKCDTRGVTVTVGQGLLMRGTGTAAERTRARSLIRAALGKVLPPITQCYLKATSRKKRATRPLEGQLVVTLRLDNRGRARGVQAAHRALGAGRVIRCAVKALRQLRVDGLQGPFFAAVPLLFGRSKGFVSTCGATTAAVASRALIDGVIKRNRSAIQYCFISSGMPGKELRRARVKIAFSVLPSGQVGPVKLVSSVLANAATNACILRTVKRWKFPRARSASPLVTPEFHWRKKNDPRRRRRRRRRKRHRRG